MIVSCFLLVILKFYLKAHEILFSSFLLAAQSLFHSVAYHLPSPFFHVQVG